MSDLEVLFRHGPPRRLAHFVRMARPPFAMPIPRILLVLALGWLPLFVLTLAFRPDRVFDLSRDIAVHARYAVAVPLLVLAYGSCGRRLGLIAGNFAEAGLLDRRGEDAVAEYLVASRALLDSRAVEAMTVLLAIAIAGYTSGSMVMLQDLPLWMRRGDAATAGLSPAGFWQFAISLPLLLTLLLGWLWRIAIWARLLARISRLDLHLVASHPDQCGGLGFLGQSLRAFSAFAMALGAIAAGRLGHDHLTGTASSFTDGLLAVGIVCLVALLCVGPLAVFSGLMMQAWRRGAMAYGALAMALGARLEAAWLNEGPKEGRHPARHEGEGDGDGAGPQILQAPDFSAAADLFAVVAAAQAMRFLPTDLRSIVMLMGATLLPFVAVLFLTMPVDVVMATLKGLLI